jgi:hypothetical protein
MTNFPSYKEHSEKFRGEVTALVVKHNALDGLGRVVSHELVFIRVSILTFLIIVCLLLQGQGDHE